MTLLNTINVGGTDYGITGAAVLGSCATPAGSEIKVCTFSDNFELKAGDMLLVKFTYANTYGDGSATYPKLQVNSTNYIMRRADGSYLQSGEWDNNATLTFLFDGTDFILPAGSGSAKGSSVPLGAILAIHSNQVPSGYLPCNGVAFDENQYPALYNLLGDNHTPDLRECTLKMIGESGRTVGAHVKSGGLSVGEFVDDRIQNHNHISFPVYTGGGSGYPFNPPVAQGSVGDYNSSNVQGARVGDTTEVKAVGVNYVIKATSGLDETQQDYVLQALNEAGSYSTEEVATGKKWIDGKLIYRKVIDFGVLPNNTNKRVAHNIANIDNVINIQGAAKSPGGNYLPLPGYDGSNTAIGLYANNTNVVVFGYTDLSAYDTTYIVIEYTKTTPST